MASRPVDQGDTLLGVCATIAHVTGLPALAIRIAFVVALFASLTLALVAYVVAAVAIHAAEPPLALRGPFLRRRRG